MFEGENHLPLAPGVEPGDVEALGLAERLTPYYDLLRRLSIREETFRFGLAVLFQLYQDETSAYWTPQELDRLLGWMTPDARVRVLGNLKVGGWLVYADGRWTIAPRGRLLLNLFAVIAKGDVGDVETFLASVRAAPLAEQLGAPYEMIRQAFRQALQELVRDRQDLEEALSTKSLPKLRAAVEKSRRHHEDVDNLLRAHQRFRELSPEYDVYRGQRVHDLISTVESLTVEAKRLIRAIYESQLATTARFISKQDVEDFLLAADLGTLQELALAKLHSPVHKVLIDTGDLIARAHEYLIREAPPPKPPPPERLETPVERLPERPPAGFDELARQVAEALADVTELPWEDVVVTPEWSDSIYRLAALIHLWSRIHDEGYAQGSRTFDLDFATALKELQAGPVLEITATLLRSLADGRDRNLSTVDQRVSAEG